MCCCCFSAIGLLGVLFACLNDQSEQKYTQALVSSKVLCASECRGNLLQTLSVDLNEYIHCLH